MTNYVWVVELAIKSGKLGDFKALANDMVAAIEANECGTLNYEVFISADEASAHIYEQYADGAAFKQHLDNFNQRFADRFGAMVDVTRFTVYGDPDSEIRALLAGFDAIIMTPLVGLAR